MSKTAPDGSSATMGSKPRPAQAARRPRARCGALKEGLPPRRLSFQEFAMGGLGSDINYGVVNVPPSARDGHSSDISMDGVLFVFGGDKKKINFMYRLKIFW